MHLTCLVPPSQEPVSLDQAKLQCRVRHSQADDRLARAIRSARQSAEARTGRALLTQTWQQTEPRAEREIRLKRWPVIDIQSITLNGTALAETDWQLQAGEDPRLTSTNQDWQGQSLVIQYRAGYGDEPDDIPEPLRDWILLQIAALYENASPIVIGALPATLGFADLLLNDYRIPE